MKYDVVLADPPWPFKAWKGKASRTSDSHYEVMTMKDIADLKVRGLVNGNAALFLWTPASLLTEAIVVMNSWGFIYKTIGFAWVKLSRKELSPSAMIKAVTDGDDKALELVRHGGKWHRPHFGMGHYSRQGVELCLLGTRGSMPVTDKAVRQVVFAPVGGHSEKPPEVHAKIERLYPKARRLELFARAGREGWYVWGNEAPNPVKLDL